MIHDILLFLRSILMSEFRECFQEMEQIMEICLKFANISVYNNFLKLPKPNMLFIIQSIISFASLLETQRSQAARARSTGGRRATRPARASPPSRLHSASVRMRFLQEDGVHVFLKYYVVLYSDIFISSKSCFDGKHEVRMDPHDRCCAC